MQSRDTVRPSSESIIESRTCDLLNGGICRNQVTGKFTFYLRGIRIPDWLLLLTLETFVTAKFLRLPNFLLLVYESCSMRIKRIMRLMKNTRILTYFIM